jgi:RNA polymerase sigma-B factor
VTDSPPPEQPKPPEPPEPLEPPEPPEPLEPPEPPEPPAPTERELERERLRGWLREFAALPADAPNRAALRDELVTAHMQIVEYVARRFIGRGEPLTDLVQVGSIGLINALDRFEPERGLEFTSYATPTVVGEIKRYFRDKGWMVRVPRRLQEVRTAMAPTVADLSQKLGRAPTVPELAAAVGATPDEIVEAMESGNAYSPVSIEAHTDPESGWSLADTLGSNDAGLDRVEYRESLKPLLAALGERERTILVLRFFENRTQSQIAEAVGVSQMHVSRLLARTLAELREKLLADG